MHRTLLQIGTGIFALGMMAALLASVSENEDIRTIGALAFTLSLFFGLFCCVAGLVGAARAK